MLSTSWQTTYQNNYRDEQRHRADTFDIANSLLRKDKTWRNILRAEANITQGKFSMNPSLELTHNCEQSDYRRGRLDTIAKRNELLVRPSMDMTYKFGKQTRLMGHIAYDSQQPDIIDCIGYYDDTNPLYIITGNPHLKTSHTLNASLRFATMSTKANQVFNVSFDYSKTYDPIGMVMHYTTSTGGYLVQKRNMRGGERWGFELNYERDFGKLRLKNKLSESFGQAYGIMTLVDDATGLSYNRQRSSYFEELLRLEYADGPFSLKLNQDFGWHRYTYSDAAQSRQNIYNYRAEFNGQYNWKSWTIQLLPTFHLNRGYMADQMNVNRFLFNASISYKFLKNKARLSLYANDLFNRDTRYHSDVTVTTRTESGSSFLHHYVCLTFNYKFDAKKR